MVAPFFGPKIGEDKKGLRCKISGFSVQKYVKTKKKRGRRSSTQNQWFFGPNEDGTKQSEKRKVFATNRWSYDFHHNMLSPLNGDIRGGPPLLATPLRRYTV